MLTKPHLLVDIALFCIFVVSVGITSGKRHDLVFVGTTITVAVPNIKSIKRY